MVIDAHHHLWDPARRSYPWMSGAAMEPIRKRYGLDDLRGVASAVGVTSTVLVQTVADVAETEEFLAEASTSGGLVAGVIGWVDLASPSVADEVARLRDGDGGGLLAGIRHQVEDEPSPEWLLRSNVASGLAAVATAGLVYDLLVRVDGIATCVTVADAHPQLSLVLDHAGKPTIASGDFDQWRADVSVLASRANVAVKLSGLVTEADWASWTVADLAPVVDHLVEEFGADRVMFGSDWPVCELAAPYRAVFDAAVELTTGLSDTERSAVFGATAERVYALSSS